ncbi:MULTISPECIES: MBL fold metallo-hydrolase [Serratia]|uniref:MBL fold metallo-hydrolase n=1 Tax=Serratia TaxID=613 RepID=UPI001F4C1A45|nr:MULTISPECIES: sulfur transferase domain-containing protein [Serratia]ULG11033.1 MBL fold metallo-hydrolase [Serratia entomophila]CAI1954667.1 Probable polyketide biosynthesis zinc-dependent hydrolase pksB [Serratia quinivorans]CAI2159054.1 Probable polyketide biosynthesis zinc-dependent hydrolase pksB [Serratia quinivorans]
MNIRHVNEQLSFSDALTPAAFQCLHQAGYALVVNHRPDEEGGEYLTHREERALAEQYGIAYVSLPFTYESLTWEQVYAFNRCVCSGKKLLAHCRTGSRSVGVFFLHALNEGLLDDAGFREQCRLYGADAEAALAWYCRQQQHTPVAQVHSFYEPISGSLQYVIADSESRHCAIIDPVLDFNRNTGAVTHEQAQRLLDFIQQKQWQVSWILDTHPHADHFSAAAWLAQQTGAPMAIGENIIEVQGFWKSVYHLPTLATPDSIWNVLFKDGEVFYVGNLRGDVMFSPGHTPASVTYHLGNCAFIHDTLFMPDSGTARTDFPGGSSAALWESVQSLLRLPADTRLFTGHDYCPNGREVRYESTIQEQRDNNPFLILEDKAGFIAMRTQRDETLPLPELMLMAIQVNINGGRLPEPERDGHRYLKIPLNRF